MDIVLRRFEAWLTVFAALFSGAAPACVDAFSDEKAQVPAAAAQAQVQQLVGISNTFDPFTRVKQNKLYPSDGIVLVEITSQGAAPQSAYFRYQDVASGATQILPSMKVQDEALGSVYKAFEGLIKDQVITDVKETEQEIPVERTLSYTVKRGAETRAFVRVFDGSDYRKLQHEKFLSDSRLPLERLLREKPVEAVKQDRAAKKSIFEIGKVMIAEDAKVRERLQLRTMMIDWFKAHIVAPESEDQTVFYADVETEKHREAYQRWFGFQAITDLAMNGQVKPPAYIMRVTLKDLKAHLGN